MEPARPEGSASEAERRALARAHWRASQRVMALLLTVWAATAYGLGIVCVEPLNQLRLGGFPLGFWFAQQGSIYVFVALIAVYAVWMDRLDRRYRVHDEPPPLYRTRERATAASGDPRP